LKNKKNFKINRFSRNSRKGLKLIVALISSGKLIILTLFQILIITTITTLILLTTIIITTTTAILITSIITTIVIIIIKITYQIIIGLRKIISYKVFSKPPNSLKMLLLILLIWPIIKSLIVIKSIKIKISFTTKTKIEFNKIQKILSAILIITIITKIKMKMSDFLIKYDYKYYLSEYFNFNNKFDI
jgi:hypothetical protein